MCGSVHQISHLSKPTVAQTDSAYINPGMVYELGDTHSLGGLSFQ